MCGYSKGTYGGKCFDEIIKEKKMITDGSVLYFQLEWWDMCERFGESEETLVKITAVQIATYVENEWTYGSHFVSKSVSNLRY